MFFGHTRFAHSPELHGRVAIRAGNLQGVHALLHATPSNGSQGKEMVPPGTVLIATIPVVSGQMHWVGPFDWRLKADGVLPLS